MLKYFHDSVTCKVIEYKDARWNFKQVLGNIENMKEVELSVQISAYLLLKK